MWPIEVILESLLLVESTPDESAFITIDLNLTILKFFPFFPTLSGMYKGNLKSCNHMHKITGSNIGAERVNPKKEINKSKNLFKIIFYKILQLYHKHNLHHHH